MESTPRAPFDNLRLIFNDGMDSSAALEERGVPLRPTNQFEQGASTQDSNGSFSDFEGSGRDEMPFEICSTYSSSHGNSATEGFAQTYPSHTRIQESEEHRVSKTWNMNYHEASIFLEEGYNNDKFDSHPRSSEALPPYLLVHNHWFYTLDLVSAYVLLALALIEKPAIPGWQVNEAMHASLELCALAVMSIELFMKFRWMGIGPFFHHKRTVLKLATLIIMIIEAFVVLVRLDSHFRVTRALRPIFLVDNHYCGGIRRVIRQIMQSMPPILDMLFLLCFFMLIFSLLGFYLFSSNAEDPYFPSLERSFVSLFVLLTTANYPDVMMPAYAQNRWSSLFFIAFLVIHLYFLMNLMLAVVYETFTRIEKKKFRKLLLHRRRACQNAFRLLVAKSSPSKILFKHFCGLMKFYKPRATKLDAYLMFKTLDIDESSYVTLDEFYKVYEVSELSWKRKHPDTPWYIELGPGFLAKMFGIIHDIVVHKYFESVVYFMITLSALYQIVEAATLTHYTSVADIEYIESSWITLFFVCFYGFEVCLKILGLGVYGYFLSGWNSFDFVVTVFALLGLITETFGVPFSFVFILRSLRLLKLFELKRRYKDIMGTFIFIMMKRFGSVSVVILILFYFYGIIGMEVFSKYDLRDCCRNSTVEQYFLVGSPNSTMHGYYYLNNFSNIATSFVTLFELMVVNNWFILMDGYAIVSNEVSRLYFMSFYIMTMVVITIVVAFVLEAFLFRIQYKRKMGDIDKDTMVVVDVALMKEEVCFCLSNLESFNMITIQSLLQHRSQDTVYVTYHGSRQRSKFSFCTKMYAEEVKEWLEAADAEDRQTLQWRVVGNRSSDEDDIRRTLSCSY